MLQENDLKVNIQKNLKERPKNKMFDLSLDLWSIGASRYPDRRILDHHTSCPDINLLINFFLKMFEGSVKSTLLQCSKKMNLKGTFEKKKKKSRKIKCLI